MAFDPDSCRGAHRTKHRADDQPNQMREGFHLDLSHVREKDQSMQPNLGVVRCHGYLLFHAAGKL
jgi:hypothetical protein